jgi:hypothetical protein
LEQQLSNGENSNAPEPPNVSVPTTQRQTPNLQSNTFYGLKMLSLLVIFGDQNLMLKNSSLIYKNDMFYSLSSMYYKNTYSILITFGTVIN